MITMSNLGRMGRWGNQVFQYTFLRTYARRFGLNYQAPSWEGQRLFGFYDPPLSGQPLPQYNEQPNKIIEHSSATSYQDAWYPPTAPKGREVIGHDYHGYCQFHTSYYAPDREFIRDLFTPVEEIQERIRPALKRLREGASNVIGLHMRRGDTGRAIFYLTPNEWYLQWLEEHWGSIRNPRLFIATEEPSDAKAFHKYDPVVTSDLLPLKSDRYSLYNYLRHDLHHPRPETMDWFPDWYILSQCDMLLFGESTFSFSAALVSQRLQECWQSKLSTQRFHLINPWNCQPLVREHLDDHPNIPDTRYASNPPWLGGETRPASA